MKFLRNLSLFVLAGGLIVYPLAAAAGALLYVVLARPVRPWPWPAASITVGVAAVIAALASDWRGAALMGAGWILLLGFALFLLFTRLAVRDTSWAVSGLALGLVIAAALAALQAQGGGQAVAFTYHSNVAAALFVVGAFGLMGALARSWRLCGQLLRLAWFMALAASIIALAFTGSRSGVLGFAGGLVVLLPFAVAAAWRRVGGWLTTLGMAVVAAATTVAVLASLPSPSTGNLVVNSGFEAASYPWRFGGDSERVAAGPLGGAADDGSWSVSLVHSAPGWQVLLASSEPIRVDADERYVLSLYTLPALDGIAGVFLRVDARDASGAFIARAGQEAWTTSDEGSAGGRWRLPTVESPGEWHRFVAALPPLPAETAELTLTLAADSRELGAYGLVDSLQLEAGTSSTAYHPGPSAGVRAYLGPLVPRLLALRDPIAASGGRISMWYFSLELAALRPFLGYGFGVVEHLVQPLAPRYVADPLDHPHSFYFQVLLEGGALLLFAILGWLGVVGWWLLRGALRGSGASATMLAALVALLVQSVFDPALAWGPVVGLWWVGVCLVGVGRTASRRVTK